MIQLRCIPVGMLPRVGFSYWLRTPYCRRLCTPFASSASSYSSKPEATIDILGKVYRTDSYTNITPSIISKISAGLTLKPRHPLCTLQYLIASHFPDYTHLNTDDARFEPLVSPQQNFDDLSFPNDHPGRSVTDSYYINRDLLLRTHTSAHEVEVFKSGYKKWLLTEDVFRRDEVDASHYPVFHQTEGARIFKNDLAESGPALREENERLKKEMETQHVVLEDKTRVDDRNPYQPEHSVELADLVVQNLKCTLSLLLVKLFAQATGASKSSPLQVRWIPAYFPFTSPSYEVEVLFQGKWLEVLGCGVIQQATLMHANIHDEIGWAFGLGLERIAMILFKIPDIRLFWSGDERFISQFKLNEVTAFKPYSKYPPSWNDISFWLPVQLTEESFHSNDFCDIVRDVAGDLAEEVNLIDQFVHSKTNRASRCFRIVYRSMDRSLKSEEVNALTQEIKDQATRRLRVEIR